MFPRDVEEFALMQFPIFICYAVPPDMALPGVNGLDAQNLVLSHQLRQADPTTCDAVCGIGLGLRCQTS